MFRTLVSVRLIAVPNGAGQAFMPLNWPCCAMLHDSYAILFIVGFLGVLYKHVYRVRSPPPN